MRFPVVVLLCLVFVSSYAQEENWETYMAKLDKKPASVLVNLALINNIPSKQYPFLLITGPKCNQCQKNGLPAADEIPQLETVLDAGDKFITGLTPKLLVGTLTYNCERVNYYYVKDTTGLSTAIARMYRRSFHDYAYVYRVRSDPDWSIYRTFLYPTDENFTWIENDKIISDLIQKGDSLTRGRNISFMMEFGKEEDRKSFMNYVHTRDFNVDELNFIKDCHIPYQIKISKYELIKPDDIFVITDELKKETLRLNGKWEGWSSPVVK